MRTGVVSIPHLPLHEVEHADEVHGGALQPHHGGLHLQLAPVGPGEREELHLVDGLRPLLALHARVTSQQQPALVQNSHYQVRAKVWPTFVGW